MAASTISDLVLLDSYPDTQPFSDSQPDTQPFEVPDDDYPSSEDEEIDFDSDVFGMLYPMAYNLAPVTLRRKRNNRVGRSSQNEYVVRPELVPKKLYDVLSKFQFNIEEQPNGTFIYDLSSNGTELENRLLGRGNNGLLYQNTLVSMVRHSCWMFLFTARSFYKTFPSEIKRDYMISKLLGSGASGEVHLCFHKATGKRFALKGIKKEKLANENNLKLFFNEVKTLKKLNHPNIVRFEEAINTRNNGLFIVMEYADSGELFALISKAEGLDENTGRYYFIQLLQALKYLHSKNIAHRDVKPENLLLFKSFDEEKFIVKLADFGLAKAKTEDTFLKTFAGTPNYLAPEILYSKVRPDRTYTPMVDMWAAGCVLYVMLCGDYAFRHNDDLVPFIDRVKYKPPCRKEVPVSPDASELISHLITKDHKRMTAVQALNSKWITKGKKEIADVEEVMKCVVNMYPPRCLKEQEEVDAAMDTNGKEELEFVTNENNDMNTSEDGEGMRAAKKRKICDN